jgi:hypothetical protein
MVEEISKHITQYEVRLREMQRGPKLSRGRRMVGPDSGQNRLFFSTLFYDHIMVVQFLKDIGLLKNVMSCDSFGRDMTWSADTHLNDEFIWRCNRRVAGVKCHQKTSIRRGSWFRHSKLTLYEIIMITYDIVCREPAHRTLYEYSIGKHRTRAVFNK